MCVNETEVCEGGDKGERGDLWQKNSRRVETVALSIRQKAELKEAEMKMLREARV